MNPMPKSAKTDDAANESRHDASARAPAANASVPAPAAPADPADRSDKPLKALDFDVPERVGKYMLGDKLGSGTCGVVYKARDEVLNRIVAIKLSPIGKPDASNEELVAITDVLDDACGKASRIVSHYLNTQ